MGSGELSTRIDAAASRGRKLVGAACGCAVLAPMVIAYVRLVVGGWTPQGDEGLLAAKVHDVFSAHPPTMGMRSTTGVTDPALAAHQPGPMQFYLMAPFNVLVGERPAGILLGSLAIVAASALGCLWVARRIGGTPLLLIMTGAAVCMQGLLGIGGVVRPLNPYPAAFPALLMLLCAWALLARRPTPAWLYVVAASYVAQANLANVVLVGALSAVLLVVGAVRVRAGIESTRFRRSVIGGFVAAGALLLVWLPSLVELGQHRPNNLQQLASYATSGGAGARIGTLDITGAVLSGLTPLPGLYPFARAVAMPSPTAVTVVCGVVFALAMVALLVRELVALVAARRSGRRVRLGVVGTGGVVWVLAFVSFGLSTWNIRAGYVPTYWFVALLAIVAFGWSVLLLAAWPHLTALLGRLGTTGPGRAPSAVAAALVVVSLLVGVAGLGSYKWDDSDQARGVGSLAVGYLRKHVPPGTPVRVDGDGFLPFASLTQALAYLLPAAGYPTYALTPWPQPEDTDFRLRDRAPRAAVQIVLIDIVNGKAAGPAPQGGIRLGQVRFHGAPDTVTTVWVG
ncbi:hypothetical protein HJ588_18165 [Flexivirga sp. ID2601S]|uniref:Glycosyltransferase RgtA/B/C/D-like domain-containing protein n=1 Tax=Flexivirga aerilata TaxID=1656889 RepID=A0A849ALG5_9MICO|nr:hypothetical protein [Flexivirga aerilata]NNG41189.1 hypothetical protein [Flexivirga aerilata]